MKYVGFLRRLVAAFIDFIIVGIPQTMIKNSDLSFIIGMGISILYFVWMNGTYGATIGKMIIHAKIVKENGKKISYSDALVRELASFLSFFVLLLGYLNIIWDKHKQGWHDKIAKTIVINS